MSGSPDGMMNYKGLNRKHPVSRGLALILLSLILSNLLFNSFPIMKLSGWTLRAIDIIALLIALILPVLIGKYTFKQLQPMLGFLLGFTSIAIGTTAVTTFSGVLSANELSRIARALMRLCEISILALAIRTILRKDTLYPAVWFIIIICSIYPLYSIYLNIIQPGVYSRIGSFLSLGSSEEGILGGGQASFNELAALCATFFLLSCSLSLSKNTHIRHRIYAFAFAAFYLLGLFLTGSRSGIGSALIGILVLVLMSNKNQKLIFAFISIALAVVLSLQQGFILLMYERLLATFNPSTFEYATTVVRFDAWKSAIHTFWQHPFIGVGYACFPAFNSEGFITTENYFLEILADTGILGISAWIWYGKRLIDRVFQRSRNSSAGTERWRQLFFPATVGLFVSNLTGNNFFDPGLLLLFFFFCIALELYSQEALGVGHAVSPEGTIHSPG